MYNYPMKKFVFNILMAPILIIATFAFLLSFVYADECFTNLDSQRNILEAALEECQEQIEKTEKVLQVHQKERTNTEYDILLIDQEVNKALLRIKSSDVIINKIGSEIATTAETINVLNDELGVHQKLLGSLLQRINEAEQRGFFSFIFSDISLSSFFARANEYESLRESMENSIRSINNLQERLEVNVDNLQEKKTEQGLVRQQQNAAANQVQAQKNKKERILKFQLAIEETTQEKINTYAGRASEIRNRLFDLRGGGAIPFEQALQFAEDASRSTGIRPAFLLGLIKHESDLGGNVGTGSYLIDMHPTRDQPIFPYVAKLLSYNPDNLRVSANPGFGWGGAMGPAQFIPSTWVCYGGLVNIRTGKCNRIQPSDNILKSDVALKVGSRGSDVKRLQQFLNKNGFTIASSGPGSNGNETIEYTHSVARAVSRFQEKYAKRILAPYGYTRGTGSVGPSTRAAVNELSFYSGPWRYEAKEDVVRDHTKSGRPSNPYAPRDAFFASSIYLTRLGADSRAGECTAARRYYAGGNWRSQVALNYCNAVISNARLLQRDIDFLNG